jgi:hypothetical protein
MGMANLRAGRLARQRGAQVSDEVVASRSRE